MDKICPLHAGPTCQLFLLPLDPFSRMGRGVLAVLLSVCLGCNGLAHRGVRRAAAHLPTSSPTVVHGCARELIPCCSSTSTVLASSDPAAPPSRRHGRGSKLAPQLLQQRCRHIIVASKNGAVTGRFEIKYNLIHRVDRTCLVFREVEKCTVAAIVNIR